MTIAVASTKTGIDATNDAVSSANAMTLANSIDTIINNVLNGAQAADRLLFTAPSALQIDASGAIPAPTQALHTITANSGQSDNLDTIGVSNNRFVVLKATALHTITITSGVGNIVTQNGSSFIMTGNIMAMLWCNGSQWSLISSGNGSAGNLSATADPGSGDDTGDGYDIGALWANNTKDQTYINVDNTLTAAIWKRITPPKNRILYRAAAATIQPVGAAAPTIANTPANANDANNTFITLPTTASSGNLGGLVSASFNLVRPAHDPIFEVYVKTDATITTQRLWIGLIDADITNTDTPTTRKLIGFRWSTNASDAGWVPALADGSNASFGTAIGTVAGSTVYKLRIRIDSANLRAFFSVNDSAEQIFGTNFPAIATDMGFITRCITTSAAVRLLNFSTLETWW